MNALETIEMLARMQGSYLSPARTAADLKPDIPRIRIWDASDSGKRRFWRVSGDGHVGHDNEARMQPLCDFLQMQVLPVLALEANVGGHFNVELHDSYSYLDRHPRAYYDNCLTFSKVWNHARAVVVPDMYQMYGYGTIPRDPYTWAQKVPRLFGAYTTTGDRDPAKNERILTCLRGLEHREVCDLRITNVAQMSKEAFLAVPRASELLSPFVPPHEQLRHQCILTIRGNTALWNLPWLLSSNSVMLQKHHEDVCWYSPLLLDGTHYKRSYSLEQALSQAEFFKNNPAEAQHMTRCANRFVRDFMMPSSRAALYWKFLLEEMADHGH